MRRYLLPILFMSLLYWSCEEEEEALPEDCLGVEGGSALVDSCGTCDDDPSNDCTEDCAGVFGGINICGCTNTLAVNYDSTATFNDSSCVFPTEVTLWGVTYSVAETDSLLLSGSQLTGSIPSEIGNLTNLTMLNLYNNQLTGSIPSEIGNLTNLTSLSLSSNQLTDSIPPEIGNLTNLTLLHLSDNQLTGSIPPEIGNLTNLNHLRLHSNQLTGEIPPEIGNLTNLLRLYLYDNQLTGEIPENICDLNIYWSSGTFRIYNNQLCPPYPSCVEDYVGTQDTSGCPSVVCETYYTENIAPILTTSCTSCHSGSSPQGGLDLSTYNTVKASLPTILDRVNREEGTPGFMPLGGSKLSNANLDTLYSFSQMECDE